MPARLHDRATVVARLAEVFREHGFEGASLKHIEAATGLGKGSLYHAFPGGKEDMAAAVLSDIDGWFETHVFGPLADPATPPHEALVAMLEACQVYFHGGGRVCLVGVFALGDTRDRFTMQVNGYFRRWGKAIAEALHRTGFSAEAATDLAEEVLARIQGGLVIARAFNETAFFGREIERLRDRLCPRPAEKGMTQDAGLPPRPARGDAPIPL